MKQYKIPEYWVINFKFKYVCGDFDEEDLTQYNFSKEILGNTESELLPTCNTKIIGDK